ncbi:uncharacterized protein LACBIDRAFT_305637 [Laccaria bicolor S238N-H82]|uniref:Predicted protein n=1 Tax=Laccaria bicolor (strain S238N-H82 / ATCC MYA-4686) TaxID=486041 RepID=B0CUP8_LACBS|nr:uncharacterized protein LACBIDRAFT_305637 [Laccaria bicolor S238N-H82]EDR14708.1 predicted protein [Laccaria bicolor S238N-H82]|eukprot:XP_001875267.1 predicted protein [Laccaria bicolor S238N-H82]
MTITTSLPSGATSTWTEEVGDVSRYIHGPVVGGLLPVATRVVLVWVGDEVDVEDGEGEVGFGELADSPVVVYSVEDVVSDFFSDRIRC